MSSLIHSLPPPAVRVAGTDESRLRDGLRPIHQSGANAHMTAIRVLVADSHAVVRAGLKALIDAQPDMQMVGEADDGPAAISLAAELEPDVVVMELTLPGLDGAEVAARLRVARPGQRVLILTASEDKTAVLRMLSAGAGGYILKRAPVTQLIHAIHMVAGGGTSIDPLMPDWAGAAATCEMHEVELSEREAEVLRLIAQGYTHKETAARLRVSIRTVETYKRRSMEKLGLSSRVDLVHYAAQHGWLTEG